MAAQQSALGTARWANGNELLSLKVENYEEEGGKNAPFLIGSTSVQFKKGWNTEDQSFMVSARTDQHALVCMGARGGKGTSILLPNILTWRGSCVVIDPKGENATIAANRRGSGSDYSKGLGQKVVVLDPFAVAQVDDEVRGRFNPLDTLDPEGDETIDMATRIADAIIVSDESADPHWNESARYLIKGLILHVISADDFEGVRNLITLRKLLVRGDWITVDALKSLNKERDADGEEPIDIEDPFDLLWEGLLENEMFHGVIAGVGQTFKSMSEKERASVLSTAKRQTEFIESPAMMRSLETSDFSVSELKTDPKGMSLFLSLPTRYMATHFRWLRMIVTLVLDEMERIAHQPKSGWPVLVVLDEFPGLKRMQRIEEANAQIPGYGVKLVFVCQSLAQLKDIYKENWNSFIACSGVAIFGANQDEMTLKYISQRLGQTEVMRSVDSQSRSTGFLQPGSDSISDQIHKRALLSEDEVAQQTSAQSHQAIAFISGYYPVKFSKQHYFESPPFVGLFDPHPDHIPPQTLENASHAPALQQTPAAPPQNVKFLENIPIFGWIIIGIFMFIGVADFLTSGNFGAVITGAILGFGIAFAIWHFQGRKPKGGQKLPQNLGSGDAVSRHLEAGNKIQALKEYRGMTGCSLEEAKRAIREKYGVEI